MQSARAKGETVRYFARIRRAAQARVGSIYHARPSDAVVGPEGFTMIADKLDLRPRRNFSLRNAGAGWHGNVGQMGISRDRYA